MLFFVRKNAILNVEMTAVVDVVIAVFVSLVFPLGSLQNAAVTPILLARNTVLDPF